MQITLLKLSSATFYDTDGGIDDVWADFDDVGRFDDLAIGSEGGSLPTTQTPQSQVGLMREGLMTLPWAVREGHYQLHKHLSLR